MNLRLLRSLALVATLAIVGVAGFNAKHELLSAAVKAVASAESPG